MEEVLKHNAHLYDVDQIRSLFWLSFLELLEPSMPDGVLREAASMSAGEDVSHGRSRIGRILPSMGHGGPPTQPLYDASQGHRPRAGQLFDTLFFYSNAQFPGQWATE